MFDATENVCKLLLIIMSVLYLIISCFIHLIDLCNLKISQLIIKTIRYGKLTETRTGVLSFSQKYLEVPKSNFKYFYFLAALFYVPIALYQVFLAYLLNEKPSQWFINFLNVFCGTKRVVNASETHTIIAVFLLSLQIWRRFYETHFVSVFSKKASMAIFQFILGLFFYLEALIIMLSESPKFVNGSREKTHFDLTHLTLIDYIAILTFFWAWYHQHTTTVILSNLRKNEKGVVVTENYQIPSGDLFEYLSSPHCTTEIIMYTCLWVILGYNHSWWCIYTLVLFNQMDSIIGTHKWYKKNFRKFPKNRKLLIPFLI